MNWVYVDACTCQLRYGIRQDAQPNLTGPFDCTRQNRRLTFQDWEGFCAVETQPGVWGVYFDVEDDGLQGRMEMGTLPSGLRVLEIELQRIEKRWKREITARKMDQTINREKKLDSDSREIVKDFVTPRQNPTMKNAEAASREVEFQNDQEATSPVARESEIASQSSQSPTTIRVQPPVILSTHQLGSNHKVPLTHDTVTKKLSSGNNALQRKPISRSPSAMVEVQSLQTSAVLDPPPSVKYSPVRPTRTSRKISIFRIFGKSENGQIKNDMAQEHDVTPDFDCVEAHSAGAKTTNTLEESTSQTVQRGSDFDNSREASADDRRADPST
jgi:hypothetical protein